MEETNVNYNNENEFSNEFNNENDFSNESVIERQGFIVRNRQGMIGFAIGSMVFGGLGLGAWLYERSNRKALLRDLEFALTAIDKSSRTDEPITMKKGWFKKEVAIPTTPYQTYTVADLQGQIMKHMVSGKIKGKERQRWVHAFTWLSATAQRIYKEQKVSSDSAAQEAAGA